MVNIYIYVSETNNSSFMDENDTCADLQGVGGWWSTPLRRSQIYYIHIVNLPKMYHPPPGKHNYPPNHPPLSPAGKKIGSAHVISRELKMIVISKPDSIAVLCYEDKKSCFLYKIYQASVYFPTKTYTMLV